MESPEQILSSSSLDVAESPVGSPEKSAMAVQIQLPVPEEVVVVSDDFKQNIIKQVEYYFSDENLPTDKFMRNQIKRDKEGFVRLSVIASFMKMERLTTDNSIIESALKDSSQLILSHDKKMVKRRHPFLVAETKDPKLCTVLVENLPEDHSTENLLRIFGEIGNIKNLSVLDPHAVNESANGGKKGNEKMISAKLHALVEYETVEAAEKAVAALNNDEDWRNGMRVKLLKNVKILYGKKTWREAESEKSSGARGSNQSGNLENQILSKHQAGRSDNPNVSKHKVGHGENQNLSKHKAGDGDNQNFSKNPAGNGDNQNISKHLAGHSDKHNVSKHKVGHGENQNSSKHQAGHGENHNSGKHQAGHGENYNLSNHQAGHGENHNSSKHQAGHGENYDLNKHQAGHGDDRDSSKHQAGHGEKHNSGKHQAGHGENYNLSKLQAGHGENHNSSKHQAGYGENHDSSKHQAGYGENHDSSKHQAGHVENQDLSKQQAEYGESQNVGLGKHQAGNDEDQNLNEHDMTHNDEDGEHLQKEKAGKRSRRRGGSRGRKYHSNNCHGTGHGHGTTINIHGIETTKPPPGPKMPDGTRGFAIGRGRPLVTNQS